MTDRGIEVTNGIELTFRGTLERRDGTAGTEVAFNRTELDEELVAYRAEDEET